MVSGAVASVLFVWSPLLAGGLVMILLTWVLTRRTPSFKDYDAENPQS